MAFRIPNLLRRLFGEGSLTMAFVPVFSRVRKEQGDAAAFEMARSSMLWLLLILGALTVLAIVGAKYLVLLIAPGLVLIRS